MVTRLVRRSRAVSAIERPLSTSRIARTRRNRPAPRAVCNTCSSLRRWDAVSCSLLMGHLGYPRVPQPKKSVNFQLVTRLGRYPLWHAHEFTQQQLLGRFEPEPVADLAMYLRQ